MRHTAVLIVLLSFTASTRAEEADATAVKEVRTAIEKGLKRIEAGAANYPKHRQCFSCHHQAMAVLSMTSAKQRGFVVNEALLKKQVEFSLKTFLDKSTIAKGRGVGGDSTSAGYALTTFAAGGLSPNDTTAALVEYLLAKQRKDGSWPIAARGDRPPTMGSLFTNAALALAALKKWSPPDDPEDFDDTAALRERIDAAIGKGGAWLLANKPESTEDRVFHLRGLVDVGADVKEIEAARKRLLAEQLEDGSWAQLSSMSGDAYATATVMTALRHGGLDTKHAAYRKAVRYLLKTQREDGAWLVKTRSNPVQIFFDNGDPGEKSQFISFAATGWAVLALLETIPVRETGTK